jgi:CTP synthase
VPYLSAAGELKTKPTQRSVRDLREIGIQPDVLVCRSEKPIPPEECEKIALFCNVERRAVIEQLDKKSIYEVPLSLVESRLDQLIVEKLNIQSAPLEIDDWRALIERIKNPELTVKIALVGKYAKLRDAYKSVYESLDHAGIFHKAKVEVVQIEAEQIEKDGAEQHLIGVDGLLVPGGFDKRGIPGKISAIKYARENGLPFFGICLGLQCATIEYARNVLGLTDCNSTEFNKDTLNPVVCMLDTQRKITQIGGTMRLGAFECQLLKESKAYTAFQATNIFERHRHRYEVNNDYREQLQKAGLLISGTSPDGALVEVIELPNHPWFVAIQSHPEFLSKPTRPHPLFRDFIGASLKHQPSHRRDQASQQFVGV